MVRKQKGVISGGRQRAGSLGSFSLSSCVPMGSAACQCLHPFLFKTGAPISFTSFVSSRREPSAACFLGAEQTQGVLPWLAVPRDFPVG